jgi:hypothetical protein
MAVFELTPAGYFPLPIGAGSIRAACQTIRTAMVRIYSGDNILFHKLPVFSSSCFSGYKITFLLRCSFNKRGIDGIQSI